MTARLLSFLLFFTPIYLQGATIKKIMKGPQPKIEIFMSRGEAKSYAKGDKVSLKTKGIEFSGVVKSKKNQKVLVGITKGKILLNRAKKGSLITVKNKSVSISSKTKKFKSKKKSPYRLAYTARGSERERLGNSLSLDVEGGVAGDLIPTTGLTIGAHVSHNTLMELSYSQGIKDQGEVEAIANELELQNIVEQEAASLRIKHFFGNSFYTNSGVGARRTTVTGHPIAVAEFLPIADGPLFSKSRADAIFEFSVGNKWQMSFFNLGIDWVGISAPISKIRLPNNGDNLADSQEDLAIAEISKFANENGFDDSEFTEEPGTTFSSKIYIGFSF